MTFLIALIGIGALISVCINAMAPIFGLIVLGGLAYWFAEEIL